MGERHIIDFAAQAGQAAAFAVAGGARRAMIAREELVEKGTPGVAAWDDAWKHGSAPLVKQWREEALSGALTLQDALSDFQNPGENEGGRLRMDQVLDVLE